MQRKKQNGYSPPSAASAYSVREAKARFSYLVDRAAEGEEVIITWHGRPKVRLVPVSDVAESLRIDWDWLNTMPVKKKGAKTDALIRRDRDSRG